MNASVIEILGATKRGGMRGFGTPPEVLPPTPSPRCGCHPIFYFGTAVGAIAIVGIFLAAVT